MSAAYSRVLLKLSGEALMGDGEYGVSPDTVRRIGEALRAVVDLGVQVAVVVGGGNIFRGVQGAARGMDRSSADSMGMLATVINALALEDGFEKVGLPTRVMTGIDMPSVAEPFTRRRALRHLNRGRVVIFGGGTGNPYFTTDTAGALRALEIDAEVILKATKVDGIYDSDPQKNPDAKRYESISYSECLGKDLKVMDAAAISLCRDNDLPVVVFSLRDPSNILRACRGEAIGTTVRA